MNTTNNNQNKEKASKFNIRPESIVMGIIVILMAGFFYLISVDSLHAQKQAKQDCIKLGVKHGVKAYDDKGTCKLVAHNGIRIPIANFQDPSGKKIANRIDKITSLKVIDYCETDVTGGSKCTSHYINPKELLKLKD